MRKIILHIGCLLLLMASRVGSQEVFSTKDYVQALKKVTDIMVNDATSPVAASRYYAYITLAANEVQGQFREGTFSFAGKLNGFHPVYEDGVDVANGDASLATIYAVMRMGEKLLPSGYLLANQADSILILAGKKGIEKNSIEQTKKLAETVIQQIITYAYSDGFRNLSGYPKYTPYEGDGMWQPTGPVFMAALEPHWNKVRTFVVDSARQFKPGEPVQFDTARSSPFYQQLIEVYHAGKNLNKDQQDIALFWDCNPFAVQQIGHVEFGLKKLSPGGHWIGITGIACLKKKKNLQQTAYIHAMVAITLTDAFISCWDEKYRSHRVRPETVINRWIDPRWRPMLQTPPFPEYTSGHSVISTAVASLLTKMFGDNFTFVDDTENEFGLQPRKFKSFKHAAEEAAISRFYGGIHYMDAIKNGQEQGKKVGRYIIEKLKL